MDIVNELANVADGTAETQLKSEKILKEIAASRKRKKDASRGRVMSTYFSAIEAAEINRRCNQASLSTSAFLHEAGKRFLQQLAEEDGVLIPKESEQLDPALKAESQARLDKVFEAVRAAGKHQHLLPNKSALWSCEKPECPLPFVAEQTT